MERKRARYDPRVNTTQFICHDLIEGEYVEGAVNQRDGATCLYLIVKNQTKRVIILSLVRGLSTSKSWI